MSKRSDALISVITKFSACKRSYDIYFLKWVCVELIIYNCTKVLITFHFLAPDIKRDIISMINFSALSDVWLIREFWGKHEPKKIRYF
jgi:hypothetical protein